MSRRGPRRRGILRRMRLSGNRSGSRGARAPGNTKEQVAFSRQTQGVGPTPGHSRLETIMSCRKILLPVLGGWLLSGAAFAQSQVTLQTADIQAFDAQRAKLSAASAMGYAELYTLGDVL